MGFHTFSTVSSLVSDYADSSLIKGLKPKISFTMAEKPLRLTRPYMDEEARANLLEYVEEGDRNEPPIFVGRDEIISRVIRDVERCRLNTSERACFTSVLNGVPGAGKTSLLSEIKNQISSEDGAVGVVSVVSLEGVELGNYPRVASAFIHAYSGRGSIPDSEKSKSTTAKFGIHAVGLERRTTETKSAIAQQVQSIGVWSTIHKNTSIVEDRDVFILLVDESQNIPGGNPNGTGKNNLVMPLHAGFKATEGIKILPVFAGLSDTLTVLSERGASRLRDSATHRIAALTLDETEWLVSAWLQYKDFGFDGLFTAEDINRVSKMFAVASEGWPRHANTYLRELGRSVLEVGSRNNPKVDLTDALDRGHRGRLRYYNARLSTADLGVYELVLSEAAQQSKSGILEMSTLNEIAYSNYEIPALDSGDYVRKSIRSGILEEATTGSRNCFEFSIPSLFTYMRCGLEPDQFQQKIRAHMNAQAHRWKDADESGKS